MSRLLKDSKDLKRTIHIKRWYFLFTFLFAVLSLIFEVVYRVNIHKLIEETEHIQQTKVGKNIEIALFKDKSLRWILKGEKVNFKLPREVIFEKFFAQNKVENYTVRSDLAVFYIKRKFIELRGNVIFKKLTPDGKVIQTVKAKNAYIDLNKKQVWGKGRVIIESGNKLITGYDYRYDIAKGKFIILHDVATTIISK